MYTIKNLSYLLVLGLVISCLFSNCTKSTTLAVNNAKKVMEETNSETPPQEISTFFLVRHAEKASTGEDPSLTTEGQERAEELARFLQEVPIDAIYSTDYKRTMETAMPTATAKNVPIESYDPSDLATFAAALQEATTNKKILIVGHSNTTPALINIFANSDQYTSLSEKQYDNMYILSSVDRKVADVLTIKYGKVSPF